MRGSALLVLGVLLGAACQCAVPASVENDAGAPVDGGLPNWVGPDCEDADGDGFGPRCSRGGDCNDADPRVHPAAREVCDDGVDNNCDGRVDPPDCACVYGVVWECSAYPAKVGVGICRKGLQRCDAAGARGPCQGEVPPGAEFCDGKDNDCNGKVDDGVTNACGTCGTAPAEVCHDGLDNDCDGVMDEGCGTCDPGCQCAGPGCTCRPAVNQPCYGGPPQTAGVGICRGGLHDCLLVAGGGYAWGSCRGQSLPATDVCGDRLDNDCDGTADEGCQPACTPSPEVCDGKDNDCDGLNDEGVTNACGGCGPASAEQCDGMDNNCDGRVDEGCACSGASQACYRGPANTRGVGVCRAGSQPCSGGELATWGECGGDVVPGPEVCGDRLDNDCDGIVDNGCVCLEGATQSCGSSAGECRPGSQTCTRGAWGPCQGGTGPASEACDGKDNDCDGLVDEGVLNACGKCPPNPCYTDLFDSSTDLARGTFDGVSQSPSNPLDPNCVPGNLCLDSSRSSLPYIWIANSGDNAVVKLNTRTGQKLGPYPSHGESPSRTAVVPSDGSVWVGNRGWNNPTNIAASNLVHLKEDGSLICRADIAGIVRAVALDADGNVWAGSFNDRKMYKVSGTTVDGTQSPPRCQILATVAVSACPYGAAVDVQNRVWVAGNCNWASSFNTSEQALLEIDARTATVNATRVPPASLGCFSNYGIAVDGARNVWLGSYGCQSVIRYDPGSGNWTRISIAEGTPRGIAVSTDGKVYTALSHFSPGGAANNTKVAKVDRATNTYSIIDLGAQGVHPIGVAIDLDLKIWAVALTSGTAARIDPSTGSISFFATGNSPYTYSDMTGLQNLLFTKPTGTWTVDFDSGYLQARFRQVTWKAIQPAGTTVSARARSAATQAGLASAAWSAYRTPSPADISTVPANRWLQVEVKLDTSDPTKTPVVQEVAILWER